MRIAILSHEFPGAAMSGVASYTIQCARALGEAGHEVHVFTFLSEGARWECSLKGVFVHAVRDVAERVSRGEMEAAAAGVVANAGAAGGFLANGELLCEAVREAHAEKPFDIIETPEVMAAGLSLLIRPIEDRGGVGVPVVAMIHSGTAISRKYNELMPTADDELLIAMEFATLLLADALCAPTRAVVEETRRMVGFEGEVAVFPSPVSLNKEIASGDVARRGGTEGTFVMFAGRLETLKGCRELAIAANDFLGACADAELRLYGPDVPLGPGGVGGGSMRGWMLERIEASLHGRVKFMGSVAADQMAGAYAQCRFVVVPSRFENFGTVSQEAILAERPVLYTGGNGLDETVGDAGLRVPRGDVRALAEGLKRMWNDGMLREQLIERGRARRQNSQSNATAVAKRVAFYNGVIAAGTRDRGARWLRLSTLPPVQMHALLKALCGITGRLCGVDAAWADSPGSRAREAIQAAKKEGASVHAVWLYGAGKHTRRLLMERQRVESVGCRLVGIIDDAAQPGASMCALPVVTREALLEMQRSGKGAVDMIVLSSDSMEDVLWRASEQLRAAGIRVLRLYSAMKAR